MIAPSVYSPAPSAPPQPGLLSYRFATPDDDEFVADLQELAFGPGRFARTAYRVRERFPIDKSLSLIAEVDGTPVRVGLDDADQRSAVATATCSGRWRRIPISASAARARCWRKAARDIALERGRG